MAEETGYVVGRKCDIRSDIASVGEVNRLIYFNCRTVARSENSHPNYYKRNPVRPMAVASRACGIRSDIVKMGEVKRLNRLR